MDTDYQTDYDLSFQAHISGPARCVSIDDDDNFVASTTEGVVTLFSRSTGNTWRQNRIFDNQRLHGVNPGLLLAICKHTRGTFVSGGTDGRAVIWSTNGSRLGQLIGHSKPVNSVAQVSNGDVITGSQDGTAIVWRKQQVFHKLEGHEFGVEVCSLLTGEVCTASGNRSRGVIRLWRNGVCIAQNDNAHQHIIRKVIRHPLGLASCANDGFVKVWTLGPPITCVMSVFAHPPTQNADSFVYGIALLPLSEMIVSVGEDGFARVIGQDGTIEQAVRHPSSVRDVAALSNSDFVTSCSDGAIRIWSKCASRLADESERASYVELIRLSESSNMQTLDPSQLRPVSALQSPGEHPGQIIIVNFENKGPTVFQWDQDGAAWQEIGAALGSAARPVLDGVEYDHIVDVVVHEGAPPVKLGFNVSDDPNVVARTFCTRYGLGQDALPQIISYLTPLANPVARLSQEEHTNATTLHMIPAWKCEGFSVDSKLSTKQLDGAVKTGNATFVSSNSAAALDARQMEVFDQVVSTIERYHVDKSQFTIEMSDLVAFLMSEWPLEKLLPILDLLRMITAVHPDGVYICERPTIKRRLSECISDGGPTHFVLAMKIFSNWMAKRGARPMTDPSESVLEFVRDIIQMSSAGADHSNSAVNAAYIVFVHNAICYIGRYYQSRNDETLSLLELIVRTLFSFFSSNRKEKPTFMALLVLGTIGYLGGKQLVTSKFGTRLEEILSQCKNSQNTSIKQAAREAATVFAI